MNFSTNQNRQFYVVKKYVASKDKIKDTGDAFFTVVTPTDGSEKYGYLTVKGADTVLRSALIRKGHISHLAKKMAVKKWYKTVGLQLDANVNGGLPIAGQDYIVRLDFTQAFAKADDSVYIKHGAVHAYTGMTAGQFYCNMLLSLLLNFSRELDPLVQFGWTSTAGAYTTATIITKELAPVYISGLRKLLAGEDVSALTDFGITAITDVAGIVITEAPQSWQLGTKQIEQVYFDVNPGTVLENADERIWGTVTVLPDADVATLEGNNTGIELHTSNGKVIADMEWFYMGERGDQYRGMNYPDIIPTKYLVDPTKEYDTLDIHFNFTDTGINSYKSEKEIVIVEENGGTALTSIETAVKSIEV